MNATPHSVVVTGIGATTPLGGDSASTWEGLVAGRSGVRLLEEEWAADMPVRIAAKVAVEPSESIPRAQARKLDRSAQFALIAAREAWADAGFTARAGEDSSVDPDRLGTVVASGIGGVTTLLGQYDILREKGVRRVSPHTVPMLMPNGPSANVGLEVNARAGVHTPVSACASGSEAVGYGIEMIRTGRADVVVAGGTEAAIHPLPIAAFANMMAMSKNNDDPQGASRPYDAARNGFVLGEGAGVIVLESAEHARARGARVYAEAVGQGISADSHDIVQPEPSGNGIAHALQDLIARTGLDPAEVMHINAHATSTPQGDLAELKALRKVFGDDVDHMAISATKSMTGHLLGGAGGVETVATLLALHHRTAPPTINIENLDPDADADVVRDKARELPAGGTIAGLNNSFGFGGHNVVLAFRTV
ncbi:MULTISPECIES: beta-ketoacyl-[acyl-carrier-protein] synthase family protein [unclassified Streptomyces]|uniref:beta-ketoacyl-[acyl-carrier-protein] synthase family protein n=1 Tax=unclassified Streptomyces TaxID=2593676 RepID=UPI002DD89AE2|nr:MULTISPECIES: beta-ketoacyl-[acyl-carrier-protein] synthase family protein [unclassified Streptomyces]WSA94963.1 beta-ketoacyl-[acyl-carrier-protein] synthase family protein [Streptomyces sp. NBC_01795]WSB79383.1 beta-ketoacyl-[acyl-carrier-protein] synthase family protein [Streptomyces sp. NBC_01775]WSS12411.1 beta-ketoacyl-[acyl-carrier-protein] synthase family protein [Streptomyces sp. NBC_01186]WSS41124.1 beta-ketoacyl-[acyl-carrier-protein] synthase family protein [Streptomyces sp. NBC_